MVLVAKYLNFQQVKNEHYRFGGMIKRMPMVEWKS